jgi:hypothetical protein
VPALTDTDRPSSRSSRRTAGAGELPALVGLLEGVAGEVDPPDGEDDAQPASAIEQASSGPATGAPQLDSDMLDGLSWLRRAPGCDPPILH